MSSPGLFSPPMNETTGEKFTVGLRLPGLRLQVFEVLITVIVTQAGGLVCATLAYIYTETPLPYICMSIFHHL